MITKYKVNEVAKDLGLNNKEIIEVLGKFYEEPKKAQTALDTKELDVLFEIEALVCINRGLKIEKPASFRFLFPLL